MQKDIHLQQPDEEYFAVVNGKDEYIYSTKSKKILHKHKLLHRGIHIFIETVDNKLVIQKKAPGTENENTWSSAVSGHVRYGESYRIAARRELEEELGISIDMYGNDLKEEFKIKPSKKTANEFVVLFSYIMNTDKDVIKLESDEVSEVKILPKSMIVEDIRNNSSKYSPAFLVLMEKYLRS